jgi:hypothetical protein
MPDITIDYGARTADMQAYMAEGEARAMALGNRGPITFTDDGALSPGILEAYWRTGFYVFENVMRDEDIVDIKADVDAIRSRYPVRKGAFLDATGWPAIGLNALHPTSIGQSHWVIRLAVRPSLRAGTLSKCSSLRLQQMRRMRLST